MKLKYDMVILELDNGFAAVADEYEQYPGILQMNQTAADIIEGLSCETTEDALTAILMDKYNIDEAAARRNVCRVLAQLREKGLLEA